MTVRPPAYQSEPQILFLYQLVREIAAGHVLLPRFQRPYVWTEEQELELFRSIRMGTPIGSIMVWRTNVTDVRAYDKLGPYVLKPAEGPIRQYIIDGHQRLATLFGALHVPASDDELPERIAYFDLEVDDFIFESRDKPPKPMWLPLRYILDFPNLLPFQRSFGGRPDEKDLVRRVDIIATAFGSYKLPFLPVVSNDIDHITKTFQRINSQGTVMSEVHMVSALTWSESFDLNERIAMWKEEHLAPLGYGDLDDAIILYTCKAALGFDVYEGNVDKVSKALKDKPEALTEAAESLVTAVKFLRNVCKILSPNLLPYVSHIVPLSEAIRRKNGNLTQCELEILRRWYWLMAYSGTRAGMPKLLAALDKMHGSPDGTQDPLSVTISDLPRRFDFRNARCKLLALRLAERLPNGAEVLAREGARAVVPLILGYGHNVSPELLNSPANRIVVSPDEALSVRANLMAAISAMTEGQATKEQRALLDLHVIPRFLDDDDDYVGLHRDFYVNLLDQRNGELHLMESEFLYGPIVSYDS
jgi:hypothetical protein